METSDAPRTASAQWVDDHDVMIAEQTAEYESRDASVRHDDVRYDGEERATPRRAHQGATATTTSGSEYAYYPLHERYDEGATAPPHELSSREDEYEPNKKSLGFIMNDTATSAPVYAPAPPRYRPAHSQPSSRESTSEAMPYASVPSSLFRLDVARPTIRSLRSVHQSADFGSIHREADHDTARLQLLPPLESRQRAVSTRSSAATDEVARMLVQVAQTARPTKKKTEKKRKVMTTSASKAMSYEEKRRSRECKIDGCENYIINKGLCFRHGGGKKCSEDGCTSSAKNAGKCWKHGGSIECLVDGCERRGKSRGLCWAHGGGTKCLDASCSKVAVSNGFCWAHGGGKRCAYEGCNKAAYERMYNYCSKHHDQLKDGSETLEV